ncbi:MAG: copper homeostasis protein CutC [Nocardioides sp.]
MSGSAAAPESAPGPANGPTTGPANGQIPGLLEVTVWHRDDVVGAQGGGADRLLLLAPGDDGIGVSPDLPTASSVVRVATVPVWVFLRLNNSLTTTGGEFTRLIGLAEEFLTLGAQGVVFGFLDANLEIDVDTCAALAAALPGVPWMFHHGFDLALDTRLAWRRVRTLPRLVAVHSGGSPRGVSRGYEDLLRLLADDADLADRLVVSGGLVAEHVPWFARAGVRQFHVSDQVRPGRSPKAYVDAELVRSWRTLLDSVTERTRPA